MYTRKRIYDQFRKLRKSHDVENLLFIFYSEVMTVENTGSMVRHFQNMVESIIEDGTAIPVPDRQMRKREQLGLPEFHFDNVEIKKIVKKSKEGLNE